MRTPITICTAQLTNGKWTRYYDNYMLLQWALQTTECASGAKVFADGKLKYRCTNSGGFIPATEYQEQRDRYGNFLAEAN